jgi:hypothetical protein
MTATLACLFAAASPSARGAAPATPREQWLIQTRAADAIGEVLMNVSARAESFVNEMRHELAKAGEESAAATPATTGKSPATRESPAAYRALVDPVVAQVRRTAAGEFDPSLENLPDEQLFSEMTALQSYNLRTFRRLAELRGQAADLRARLEALGRRKGDATTRPTIESPAELARQAIAALRRPQRSPEWAAARQKMRNAIAASRAQQLRNTIIAPVASSSPYPPPVNGVVVDDPRWQPYYYGPGDGFGAWGEEIYGDPFNFRGGGGVYERYDTRVNADFDTRTRGQSDRRVNVQFDRRLNVHFDPRENF